MIGIGISNSVGAYRSFVDPAASAYFAATGLTGATERAAVNTLVTSLKSAGIWSKMKAVYPFVTDNRNLLSYTEAFDNSAWTKTSITVVANSTTAPDGTTTADTIQNQANGAYIRQAGVALSNTTYTQSCYFKKNNNNWVAMYTSDGGSNYAIAYFNINTGVVGTASAVGNFSNASSSISSASNGYYRCVLTFTKPSSASSETSIIVPDADNTFNRTAGQNVYAWGAQLELGSTATTYQPIATTQQSYISNQFKYNLVNPVDSDAAFRGVFNGGWTFSNQGALPNGVNGYMNTNFNQSGNLTASNNHISVYSRTDANGSLSYNTQDCGITNNVSYSFQVLISRGQNLATSEIGSQIIQVSNLDSRGFYLGTSTSSTSAKLYKNGSTIGSSTTSQTRTMFSNNVYFGASNESTSNLAVWFSPREYAFASIGDGLTDTQASNFYTAVQTFNQTLNRQVGPQVVSDADAQAYINRVYTAGGTLTNTEASAVNQLVIDMKSAGIWTAMRAVYPMVGSSAASCAQNLVSSSFTGTFSSGWTFASTGATPNGTSAFFDTALTPSTALSSINNVHLSMYSRTQNSSVSGHNMGVDTIGASLNLSQYFASVSVKLFMNGAYPDNSAEFNQTNTLGLAMGSATSSTSRKLYFNGSLLNTDTNTQLTTLPTSTLLIASGRSAATLAPSFFTPHENAFASIGDGLTDAQAASLYTAAQAFNTTLGRQVAG